MQKQTLSVPSISCGHCQASIEGALGDVDGVDAVAVDVDNKQVEVSFDAGKTSLASIRAAIEDQGHEVAD